MLETTPDYNNSLPHKTVTGVDLAPVHISPSHLLWRIQLVVYMAMLLFASMAIFPFVLTAFYWPILWLIFLVLIVVVLQAARRTKNTLPIRLSVTQHLWRLQTSAGELSVEPCDEILLWAGIIILPVRETLTGRKHRIIALPDSMAAEDWRRLRVWLRMGLRKNT